ncbi:WecB/TagA/CpsF family glycosyltransferase [Enterococcus faecalis]|uniref:WecB/TagA/CpsF family glycosyltransferase n=1 Tax=Enterococcus faecalis TaxID=1351 RepID=UPI003EDABCE9
MDVLAGSVKRAPEFYINHNLEWLYRCLTMKRYDRLMQIPKYIYLTIKYRNNKSRGQ